MARHQGRGVAKLALIAAAAPSLIQRPNFPYGLPRQAVLDIIQGTYSDRPAMMKNFGNMIFPQLRHPRHFRLDFSARAQCRELGHGGGCQHMAG
jgi:hypothetical protein